MSGDTHRAGKLRAGVALRLDGLSKWYGTVAAVEDISVSIPAGTFLTLLGPSGSGKTTTLNLISGFLAPDEGEIYFDERPISEVPVHKRNVGMVFQNYALFPHMSVFDNVAFPLRMRHFSRVEIAPRVRRALELVGLDALERRYPRQLSGGQQQRVALARAIVADPPLLLMDEPLGALDKKLRDRMQVELKELHRRLGVTVVYVTHDQSEALTLSDQIAVLHQGRLEYQGSPQDLYERPASPFVADFIGDSNFISGRIDRRDGTASLLVTDHGTSLWGQAVGDIAVGQPGVAFVRPERVRCEPAELPDTGVNSLNGRVANALYIGEYFKYAVETCEGVLTSKRPAGDGTRIYGRGDAVWLAWHREDMKILPSRD